MNDHFHHLLDANDLPAAERWFYRYHIRGVPGRLLSHSATAPRLRLPGPKPGLFNYKIHENVHAPEGETKMAFLAATSKQRLAIMVNVPVAPMENFWAQSAARRQDHPALGDASLSEG
jgi:hypothetical protein